MSRFDLRLLGALCGIAVGISAPAARAQEAQDGEASHGPFSIEAVIAGVSDYRFRGVSLSDKDPAFQPELTISHESGLYLDFWGSNIADDGGDDIEVDVAAGFAGSAGKVEYDLAAALYAYPGASQFNYVELRGTLGTAVGPGKLGAEVSYAPSQDNIGGVDNWYVAANGELPLANTPLTLTGSVGLEDGAFGDNKIDWSLGASAEVAGFTLGASYIDTAHTFGDPLTKATVVVSLSRTF